MSKKIIYLLSGIVVLLGLGIFILVVIRGENNSRSEQKTDGSGIVLEDGEDNDEINTKNHRNELTNECVSIGDQCGGGLLAYIDENNRKLIVSEIDNGTEIQWGCRGQKLGITSDNYGDGKNNTESLVNWHSGWEEPWYTAPEQSTGYCHEKNDGSVAAVVCNDLELNGYDDWFLPSKDEIKILYEGIHRQLQGDFLLREYWSSSEMSEGSAWVQDFGTGSQYGYQKSFARNVRCVRYL